MTEKQYYEAQQRIEELTASYSSLSDSQQRELYHLERACEQYEDDLMYKN